MNRFFLAPSVLLACLLLPGELRAQFEIHEISPDPVGADDAAEVVEFYNASAVEVDLSRWAVHLENPGFDQHIYVFESARKVQPGEYLRLHWRASGANTSQDAYTESEGTWYSGGSANFDNGAFALGLFEDDNDRFVGPDFSDSSKIRDFVQIGADGFSREPIAHNAGIWYQNDVVIDRGEGVSVLYRGAGDSSPDYFGDVRGLVPGDNAVPTQPAFNYGSSCSGSGGFSPFIPPTAEIPADGSTRFQVSLIDGLGPLAFLVIGTQMQSLPFGPDCTLWVRFDYLVGPLLMEGGPGQGEGRVLLDAGNPLAGSDFEVFLTFFCQDDSASKGFTLSNAVALKL